jgi:hypothetical protein
VWDGNDIERRQPPARCDGCGRTAAETGMHQQGWAVSPPTAEVPGSYCLSCASALRMLQWFVRCVACGATVESEADAESRGWRFHPDELGQLQPYCGICSIELRSDVRAR